MIILRGYDCFLGLLSNIDIGRMHTSLSNCNCSFSPVKRIEISDEGCGRMLKLIALHGEDDK